VNQHAKKAYEEYQKQGVDFEKILSWHLCFGFVVSTSEHFVMGYPCIHSNTNEVVDMDNANTLFISYACGNIKKILDPFHDKFKYVAFQRSFKGLHRVTKYETKKIHKKVLAL
jgi:hypothetical protein